MSTPRGARRREALLAAAADLLETEGFGAVSHRGVAARSGLPLAATTYYFRSRDELVALALDRIAAAHLEAARAVVGASRVGGPVGAAEALVAVVAGPEPDRDRLLALYERYLEASREPHLGGLVRRWSAELLEVVADVLRLAGLPAAEPVPRLILALIDGLVVDQLVSGGEEPLEGVREDVADVLAHLGEGGRERGRTARR